MWFIAAIAGALAVGTGMLPWAAAGDTLARVAPILGFLAAVTVLAELADAAGVFDTAATRTAAVARGRVPVLFVLVAIVATTTTVVLSLDTTAVLLTPVVLAMTRRLQLPPAPFAMLVVWLANTASLLLPVSNLTNLLAFSHARAHPYGGQARPATGAFTARMALPELAAVVATVVVLALRYRRSLGGRYDPPEPVAAPDPILHALGWGVCLAVAPLFVVGLAPVIPAAAGAGVLVVAFAIRRPAVLRLGLVPWRLVALVSGLFLAVGAAGRHGLDAAMTHAVGTGAGPLAQVRVAGVAAAASNAIDNLPAYAAIERTLPPGGGISRPLIGLLLGTNIGPLVTLWASLATLLWRERCRAAGVRISAREFAVTGVVGMPVVLVAAWAASLV